MNINREELAWAAGFFDGEGSAYITKDSKGYPTFKLKCGQAGKYALPILERFKFAIGNIGSIYGPRKDNRKESYKLAYDWETGKFEYVQAVFAMLWPFLSGYKKEQILNSLEKLQEYKNGKKYRKKNL